MRARPTPAAFLAGAAAAVVVAVVAAVAVVSAAAAPRASRPPTFHGAVGRILGRHCVECHRAGDVAPFVLDDPVVAAERADQIVEQIEAGLMPPWKPTHGVGEFVGERGLSEREISILRRWRDAGAPAGTRRGRPKAPASAPDGWVLGEPDAVLDYGEAFTVPAGADDIYRCFPVRNPFGRDVWISGIDVRPGDRRVLHHVVLYLDATGESELLDAADDGPGYVCFGGPGTSTPLVLGGWAPGNRPRFTPQGTALRLGKDDRVVVQCHYHAVGEDAPDRTTVGLHLSADPSPEPIFLVPVLNRDFTIPAGDPAYEVEALLDPGALPGGGSVSGRLLAVLPHMHLLGRSIDVDLLLPDGTEQRLVEIGDWDFDWQDTYTFRRAVQSPPFSKLRVRATYDNSAENPDNPNSPPEPVSWGDRTVDEMCLAFVALVLGPAEAGPPPEIRRASVDREGRLVVSVRRAPRGGRIEIDGVPVGDSARIGAGRLRSESAWRDLVPGDAPVELRVRRSDGRLSEPLTFDPSAL